MTEDKSKAEIGAAEDAPKRRRFKPFRELIVSVAILVICVILWRTSPIDHGVHVFLTAGNLWAVAIGTVPDAIIAVGMTFLIICGGFDLSVGSVMALTGVGVACFLLLGFSPILACLFGFGIGGFAGFVNGLMVTRARVNPLIATLAMMWIAKGAALAITQGNPKSNLPASFGLLGQGFLFGVVPASVILMLIIVVVADLLARKSQVARQIYYVGGNENAARFSGISVTRVRMACYVLSGLLAALAGIVLTSRLGSAAPTAGEGIELRAISAVIIGGATLAGGEGTVLGAFLGVIFMALITNGLGLLDVSLYWHGVVTGSILAIAVTIDMLTRPKRS